MKEQKYQIWINVDRNLDNKWLLFECAEFSDCIALLKGGSLGQFDECKITEIVNRGTYDKNWETNKK